MNTKNIAYKQKPWSISTSSLIAIFLFLLYPIASFPFILYGIYKRDKVAYVLFCLFMGVFTLLLVPSGDLYRYMLVYEQTKYYSFIDIFSNASDSQFDFFLNIVCFVAYKLGLNSNYVRVIYALIGYSLLCKLHNDICKDNQDTITTNGLAFMLFLCLVFIVGFVSLTYRWQLSAIIFAYGVYGIEVRKNKKAWFWIFLAVLNHFSFALISLFFIIQRFIKFKFPTIILIVLFILTVFSSLNVVSSVVQNYVGGDIYSKLNVYTDGYWKEDFFQDHSWRFRMMYLLKEYLSYSIWIMLIMIMF